MLVSEPSRGQPGASGRRAVRHAVLILLGACLGACREPASMGDPSVTIGARSDELRGATPSDFWTNVVRIDATCSGFLLHPYLVAYAAHCGEANVVSSQRDEVLVRSCSVSPDWSAWGVDLAICKLERPLVGTTVVPPATGCELEHLTAGSSVALVGYGPATRDGVYGRLHATTGIVESADVEIRVSGEQFGACDGDSGGPAILSVLDATRTAFRTAGILSAGGPGYCEEGLAFYSALAPQLAWIEAESGIDVTPCGAPDGSWAPGPDCTSWSASAARLDEGVGASSTCGEPGLDASADVRAPEIHLTYEATAGNPQRISVSATDSESGIRAVTLELMRRGLIVWGDTRSIPPYDFVPPSLASGSYRAKASAVDFAGNVSISQAEVRLGTDLGHSGCSIHPVRRSMPTATGLLLASVGLWVRRANAWRGA